jgi:tRNA-binding EMAP/Myf-like protein
VSEHTIGDFAQDVWFVNDLTGGNTPIAQRIIAAHAKAVARVEAAERVREAAKAVVSRADAGDYMSTVDAISHLAAAIAAAEEVATR